MSGIAVFSDPHIRMRAREGRPIYGDSAWGLQQVVDRAIKRNLDAVICAGDLLDARRNASGPPKILQEQLDRLAEVNIPFYFIQGQHEGDEIPWASLGRLVQHMDERTTRIGEHRFYGLDYRPSGDLQTALAAIPEGTDVLVCHQRWSEWMGEVTCPQGSFTEIPMVSMVITGDLHETRLEGHRGKDGQMMEVISPGSTWLTAFDHPTKKYWFLLDDDLGVKKKRLSTRPYREFRVTLEEDLEDLLGKLEQEIRDCEEEARDFPPEVQKPWFRFVYGWQVSDIVRRVSRIVGDRAWLFWRELPKPKEQTNLAVRARSVVAEGQAVTLRSVLPAIVDSELRPGVFALCEQCLATGTDREDMEAAVVRWFQQQTGDE